MPTVTGTAGTRLPSISFLLQNPSKNLTEATVDIGAFVGEADRGLVDTAIEVNTLADLLTTFGGSPAATPASLYTAMRNALLQGAGRVWGVRVGSTALQSAYVTVNSPTLPTFTLHAASPGTWASQLQYTVLPGAATDQFTLVIINSATGERDIVSNLSVLNIAGLIAAINAQASLVVATLPVVDPPLIPVGTPSAVGGLLTASTTNSVLVTYQTAAGESTPSPASIAITTTGSTASISVASPIAAILPTALVGGAATSFNVYWGTVPGDEVFVANQTLGSPYVIAAVPAAGARRPPTRNGATAPLTQGLTVPIAAAVSFPTANGVGLRPGNSGLGSSTTRHIGSSTAPTTGLYVLASNPTKPSFVALAEAKGADTTAWATQAAQAQANNWRALVCIASATPVVAATAIATAQAALFGGINGGSLEVLYNWQKQLADDGVTVLTVAPTALAMGVLCRIPPHVSAINKAVAGVYASEYGLTQGDMQTLLASRLMPMAPGLFDGGGIGLWGDDMSGQGFGAGNLSTQDGFVQRLVAKIQADSVALSGPFIGQPNDEVLWRRAQDTYAGYLDKLARQGWIPSNPATATLLPPLTPITSGTKKGLAPPTTQTPAQQTTNTLSYIAICGTSNNLIAGVATTTLYIDLLVRLSPNVLAVLIRASIGTTVDVSLLSAA